MASVIRLICPNLQCRTVLSIPQSARGKKVRCSQCGMRIGVPKFAPRHIGDKRELDESQAQTSSKSTP